MLSGVVLLVVVLITGYVDVKVLNVDVLVLVLVIVTGYVEV